MLHDGPFSPQTDCELQLELGRADLSPAEVAHLECGAVVPLNKRIGEPVDIVVQGQLIARGEVLVLDGKFCVRVTERFAERRAA